MKLIHPGDPRGGPQRTVFFVSESTGITAATLGHSLLSQFEQAETFRTIYMPYINSMEKAEKLAARIDRLIVKGEMRPIIFATMPKTDIRECLKAAPGLYLELFDTFIGPLSRELGVGPSGKSGLSHGIVNGDSYEDRMSIINFAMANDDGMRLDKFNQADVILIGVSRSGKTPTCLYLAIHFEVRAANYPLTEEDFEKGRLPQVLLDNRTKLVALTIDPFRLHRIREERRSGSGYASLPRCRSEVQQAEQLFHRLGIKPLDTTSQSIEEISSRIIRNM